MYCILPWFNNFIFKDFEDAVRVFVLANEGCGKGLLNRYRVIDLESTVAAGMSFTTATSEGLPSCIDETECPSEESKFRQIKSSYYFPLQLIFH